MGRGAGTEVVAPTPRRRGRPTFWTDERIEEKLREVVEDLGRLPRMAELNERGLGGLRRAIARKGLPFYAGRVGLPGVAPPSGKRRPPAKERPAAGKWTDERIEVELRNIVSGNGGHFPTRVELESRGLHGLRHALKQRGVGYWAERIGVGLAAGQDRAPYGIDDARRDIDHIVAETGRLPAAPALRKLGYPRLATLVAGSGGVAKFCAIYRIELPA
jgi:hypothetical protein